MRVRPGGEGKFERVTGGVSTRTSKRTNGGESALAVLLINVVVVVPLHDSVGVLSRVRCAGDNRHNSPF